MEKMTVDLRIVQETLLVPSLVPHQTVLRLELILSAAPLPSYHPERSSLLLDEVEGPAHRT